MRKLTQFSMLTMFCLVIFSCSKNEVTVAEPSLEEQEEIRQLFESNEDFNNALEELLTIGAEEESNLMAIRNEQSAAALPPEDEPFVFFVIGDSELNMRGNTYDQLSDLIDKINNIEDYNIDFIGDDFEEGESKKITKPELVFLAGDICKDRTFSFSLPGDLNHETARDINRLFNELDDDIVFFPGNGNHDWDPYQWGGGGYGHAISGLISNLGTATFVRNRYFMALQNTQEESGASYNFDRYTTWWPLITSAEFNYSVKYRGLRFTQLNQFLYQPVAMLSAGGAFTGDAPANYYQTKAPNWFQGLCDESADEETPHVVIQHFPISTGDSWWSDDMGNEGDVLRKGFMDIFEDSHEPIMFTGHRHSKKTTRVEPYSIYDHTAGYFAEGYIIAVKASASKGIYAITHVDLSGMSTYPGDVFTNTYNIPQ